MLYFDVSVLLSLRIPSCLISTREILFLEELDTEYSPRVLRYSVSVSGKLSEKTIVESRGRCIW